MPMPGLTTRASQPPGGRTSFSFNDGSDNRVTAREPMQIAQPPMRAPFGQNPGGDSSWSFDTLSGGGEQSHRHTNGLRKISGGASDQYRQAPGGRSSVNLSDASSSPPGYNSYARDNYRQAPGGRSNIDLSDGTTPRAHYNKSGGDALDNFVQHASSSSGRALAQLPSGDGGGFGHRNAIAPPGGLSSFSLGWGEDNHVNHHHHYARSRGQPGLDSGPPPAMGHLLNPQQPPFGAPLGDVARKPTNAAFDRAFAVDQHMKPNNLAHQSSGGGDFFGGGGIGGGIGGGRDYTTRSSTRVAAPPGGVSSITFG